MFPIPTYVLPPIHVPPQIMWGGGHRILKSVAAMINWLAVSCFAVSYSVKTAFIAGFLLAHYQSWIYSIMCGLIWCRFTPCLSDNTNANMNPNQDYMACFALQARLATYVTAIHKHTMAKVICGCGRA